MGNPHTPGSEVSTRKAVQGHVTTLTLTPSSPAPGHRGSPRTFRTVARRGEEPGRGEAAAGPILSPRRGGCPVGRRDTGSVGAAPREPWSREAWSRGVGPSP